MSSFKQAAVVTNMSHNGKGFKPEYDSVFQSPNNNKPAVAGSGNYGSSFNWDSFRPVYDVPDEVLSPKSSAVPEKLATVSQRSLGLHY